ncbi:MAG TPA: VanZ family protein [Methylomirabilota bacterium]|nr:VanZ family protein [Methylomirabilota bacterium]
MSRLATWAPPIVWMAVVLVMSSADFSAENTGGLLRPLLAWVLPWLTPESMALIHGGVRKAAHAIEYGLLGGLWFRAFTRSGTARPSTAAGLALALSVACALVDEGHQALEPSRTGSLGDVLIDSLGALAAILPARLGWRRAADATTGVLLWIAAVGGLAALALGLAAGASGGVLWFTVPAAAALLIYRWRKGGSPS